MRRSFPCAMRLDEVQRRELGKALFDVGKLAFAISVATPLVTTGLAGWRAALVGSLFVLSMFVLATRLMREEMR